MEELWWRGEEKGRGGAIQMRQHLKILKEHVVGVHFVKRKLDSATVVNAANRGTAAVLQPVLQQLHTYTPVQI